MNNKSKQSLHVYLTILLHLAIGESPYRQRMLRQTQTHFLDEF